jgi:hypothetical protein
MATQINKVESVKPDEQTNQQTNQQEQPKGGFGLAFGQNLPQEQPKGCFGLGFVQNLPQQQAKPGLTFGCGNPTIPTTQQSSMSMGFMRHPETGQPIQNSGISFGLQTNNRCFPIPSHITDAQQDKKKIVDSLYQELSNLRSEIDRLNKSIDTIYSIIRHL